MAGLTARQQEILRLLARRWTDREIAEALCLSPHTVHRHTANLFAKLGVANRREAAAAAARLGLD
jgi:DNA-binding NarL/FixJ family response regulator